MNNFNETRLYKQINTQVAGLVKPDSKLLDVGCSAGTLGGYLIANKNCRVYGVDNNPQAINLAAAVLTAVAVMNIGSDPFPFRGELFDIIIFGDVLEHLTDPQSVLMQFQDYLAPGGYMIVSLPNIANIIIRLKLLFGKWEYKEYGIMDATHLRFFTRQSSIDMFNKAGLQIQEIKTEAGVFVKDNLAEKFLHGIYRLFCTLFPRLFATQFIFKLVPE
ncbi:MAG TPA: class I SAM-dependent methyltransferase [bacterium]|nr:class I SAM-dependent methyltransferase [bacterium]HPN45228.1 class I SAM-dependent methyltransferase [bacterium]